MRRPGTRTPRWLPVALLAVTLIVSGCVAPGAESGKDAARGPAEFKVNGVAANATTGNVRLVGENGIRFREDPGNATIVASLSPVFQPTGVIRACRGECDAVGVSAGMVVAEGSLLSFNNVSLNAAGPDRDSAVFFHDDGHQSGQWIQWRDAPARFETSAGLHARGSLTAKGHVGSVMDVPTPEGTIRLHTAALEGTAPMVYMSGSAKLTNGTSQIRFPPLYQFLWDPAEATVHITPTSRIPPLFVSVKSADGIRVETIDGTPANGTFDVLVIAPRAGAAEAFQGATVEE